MIVTIPMRLPSAANLREHWRTKARRVQKQRGTVALLFGQAWRANPLRGQVYSVHLARIAPRKLDDDNLASAFKAVRDQIAAEIGIDDGSDRFRWTYEQRKAKECAIEIFVSAYTHEAKP